MTLVVNLAETLLYPLTCIQSPFFSFYPYRIVIVMYRNTTCVLYIDPKYFLRDKHAASFPIP